MAELDEKAVRRWMRAALRYDAGDYDDCGEINRTLLGENCADALDLAADDDASTIPDIVWDIAHEVAEKWETECAS